MPQKILLDDDINFVNNLLIKAGDLAVELQHFIEQNNYSTGLTIDQRISEIIVSQLEKRFTSHAIISEESVLENSVPIDFSLNKELVWFVDPIDGTHHYLAGDSQYSIMVGLLHAGEPIYGWVYNPAFSTLYFGGPSQGVYRQEKGSKVVEKLLAPGSLQNDPIRVLMGSRDRKNNLWLEHIDGIELIQVGSIGYKLTKILEGESDVLLHLAGRLKLWDTAGPVALALAAGFDVGTQDLDRLLYPQDTFVHRMAIVIGIKGSLDWFRSKIIPVWTQ